ncbi:MAG: SDR family oxidoreductase [Bacteroidota bacterium]|nr:SDR family oxidoreductase [Bacteroidota bacterium]
MVVEDVGKVLRTNVDADNFDPIMRALASITQPDVVINCIGMIKQIPFWAKDPLTIINLNSQLPHRISMLCKASGARMIQLSTDCVFEGTKGNYIEEDIPDATDIYGRTKFLGEVLYPHCVTIRTSTIGPELNGGFGLLEWFLKQEGEVNGFTKAIFSGFPTCVLAEIIGEYIIPNETLSGLYHISADPISKYDLLNLIADVYGKKIKINKEDGLFCDRSLDSTKFKNATGFNHLIWEKLIRKMKEYFLDSL